jgi:hypothetical protein
MQQPMPRAALAGVSLEALRLFFNNLE